MILKILEIATKGPKGEREVNEYLKPLTVDDDYILIHNLTISNSVTGLSQIDHLVIGSAGIFVIETKNYCGSISGDIYNTNLLKNGHKVHNPVCQNFGHVKAVESVLRKNGLSVPVFSIVTFPRTLSLRIRGRAKNTRIVYWDEVSKCIESMSEGKVIDHEQIKNIHDILLSEKRDSLWDKICHTFYVVGKKLKKVF